MPPSFPVRVVWLLMAIAWACGPICVAQQRALQRRFAAPSQERFEVTIRVKAESHSVTTETVARQTYVTPMLHEAEASLRWHASRNVTSVRPDGSAEIEEIVAPATQECVWNSRPEGKRDEALEKSLNDLCAFWSREVSLRYFETAKGLLQDASRSTNDLPPLGESAPALLTLWLRRAVRPNVIFPALDFEVGAKSQKAMRPSTERFSNANGSETTEWLDAQGETPAATLHVVQQLTWKESPERAEPGGGRETSKTPKNETFFADSLTTLSLLDGSVLRATRTASRSITNKVDAVPGLPQPPDFSSKLTVSITIERLP
jgi:hypothetical protein